MARPRMESTHSDNKIILEMTNESSDAKPPINANFGPTPPKKEEVKKVPTPEQLPVRPMV